MQKTNTVQEERRWVRAADPQSVALREKSPLLGRNCYKSGLRKTCFRAVSGSCPGAFPVLLQRVFIF